MSDNALVASVICSVVWAMTLIFAVAATVGWLQSREVRIKAVAELKYAKRTKKGPTSP